MKIEKVSIEALKPYENNAKIHTREQIEQIKRSIQEFGDNDPIAIDETGMIIEGHGRYQALQELRAFAKKLWEKFETIPSSIIRENKPVKSDLHPTMKPIPLCAKLIRNSSRKGENVIDFFGDSGSTLMACEETGRNAYLMELDPAFCDVIIQRWEEATGGKAVLINGNR